ncbi:hypothetical protein GCM10010112_04370 [Actinoplanes lobatus]|uniref:Uncharacterized protein n=1 Tax=Actinoplanes lobatus TaxID=113568 RepID=A0ABQ4AKZ7_9ACTN|nr:hypothetical protein GCM10010112_04370 [Actinoplanes lobatus]GIE41679.1 hypothetical protein Alo02nite_45770 [Actinoplanes lobatus]
MVAYLLYSGGGRARSGLRVRPPRLRQPDRVHPPTLKPDRVHPPVVKPDRVNPARREDGRVRPLSLAGPRMTSTVTGARTASGNPDAWEAAP